MKKRLHTIIFLATLMLPIGGLAVDEETAAEAEIEHLLNEIGQSDCIFIRNGDDHPADKAESHLRMKYGRGKNWISSADQFIERIASKSSWSGDIYQIRCPGEEVQSSEDWLTEKLGAYRSK